MATYTVVRYAAIVNPVRLRPRETHVRRSACRIRPQLISVSRRRESSDDVSEVIATHRRRSPADAGVSPIEGKYTIIIDTTHGRHIRSPPLVDEPDRQHGSANQVGVAVILIAAEPCAGEPQAQFDAAAWAV